MKWDDIFEQLIDAFKIPETLEEVKDFIKKDAGCQATIEELAFKQVVINILVAAGIVSEKDFTDSMTHFKNILTDEFAKKMLINFQQEQAINSESADEEDEEDAYWDDDKPIGQA